MSRIGRNAPPAPVAPKPAAPAPAQVAETPSATAGWAAKGVSATKAAAPTKDAGQVATEFFSAFQKTDTATFDKLYAPNATFKDPIYDLKNHDEVVHMWKSLFATGKDLKMTYEVLESSGDKAKVAWKADYKVFGRPVHNEAVSELTVKNGQIVQQQDSWSWSKWAKQALPLGPLVDFPPVKAAVLFFLNRL